MTIELAGDSAEIRKARGAFFTPPEVTRFLCAWAITSPGDRVLEPSCGDGAFLAAAAERLRELGGRAPLQAHELHEGSAADASALLASAGYPGRVVVGDFLASPPGPSFDAVVGNPPYIRYQGFTGEARATGLAAALAQGVRLSRLASSWAPFVVHAAAFLSAQGRLALVVPAELLAANYAAEVRDFLLQRFARVRVVLIEGQVFPGVQTEAMLLLAEGSGGTDRVEFASVAHAAGLDALLVNTGAFESVLEVRAGERWTTALVSAEATHELSRLAEADWLSPLSHWGRISLGAVTGNNRYFTLSPAQAAQWGLTASELVPISPAGSSHLRALRLTRAGHAVLGQAGKRTLLFRPGDEPSADARAYLAHGEALGVTKAYKCRVRTPWWRTPLPAPPDVFFTYMNEATPQLAANPSGLHYLNSVHGLYLTEGASGLAELVSLAALNSATGLSAEVTGRAYGGGVLKMEPREAARLLVPSIDKVRAHEQELSDLLPVARRLLRAGRLEAARDLVDDVLLTARAGLTPAGLASLREAQAALRQRRRQRAKSRTTRREAE